MPNHLPGTNPFLHEVADWYGLAYAATRGGAETIYPEYRKDDGQAGDAAARHVRAVLQLRPERCRLQPQVAESPCAEQLAGCVAAVFLATAAISIRAQRPGPGWETLRIQRNVYAIFGAGGNVTVQIGDEGVLVVDSGVAASAGALIAEIRESRRGRSGS